MALQSNPCASSFMSTLKPWERPTPVRSSTGIRCRRSKQLPSITASTQLAQASSKRDPAWAARRLEIKSELRALLRDLQAKEGPEAGVLPGNTKAKQRIDELVAELTQHASTDHWTGKADSRLLGTWNLVYASNGTVVTRLPIVQALIPISRTLPGVGIKDIVQNLQLDTLGNIHACNEATLGLGPAGSWRVGIEGKWIKIGQGEQVDVVKVMFEKVSFKMVGVLGLEFPDWLPMAVFGNFDQNARQGAEWSTPYVDEDMRIGSGKSSGNTFLFFKNASFLPDAYKK